MSICFKFFRIIFFTVLIGLSVFDLIPHDCCHNFFFLHLTFIPFFLVGWLVWFDLVCELYLLFQNTQLEMNSPYFGSKKGDLFLVLSLQIFLKCPSTIKWTRNMIISYWTKLRSFTLFGLLWYILIDFL